MSHGEILMSLTSDPSMRSIRQQFLIAGAFDKQRKFDFEILQDLPKDSKVIWEIPLSLFLGLRKQLHGKVKINKKEKIVEIELPSIKSIYLQDILLDKSARHKCHFIIKRSKGLENGWHYLAIRQIYNKYEVGRVTFAIGKQVKNSDYSCKDEHKITYKKT